MANRTKSVIVLDGGFGGLTSALYLSAAGYEVTVVGNTHSAIELDGYRFDTESARLPSLEEVAAPLQAVGEDLKDWVDVLPLDPICRAHYPDGTTLDVSADRHKTAAAIGSLCGWGEARAYLRYVKGARYRVPAGWFFHDPRTLRLFGAASLFGFSPLASAWYPRGGMQAVCRALAEVAEKRGVVLRPDATVARRDIADCRIRAVHTVDGERFAAESFVVAQDWDAQAHGPSHLVIHVGATASYSKIAHHNLHFGRPWQRSRYEVLTRGELMSDPTIMVSAPGVTDPTAGRQVYRIVVPVPNLKLAPLLWEGPATRVYTGEIMATLEARGYLDLGMGPTTSYVVTPADWARQGMPYGIPHRTANRPSRIHPNLANVIVTGSGPGAGRSAAQKVVGA